MFVTLEWSFRRVHKRRPTRSVSSVLSVRRPKLVTETGLIVRQTPVMGAPQAWARGMLGLGLALNAKFSGSSEEILKICQ